jgi:hypothetical protein
MTDVINGNIYVDNYTRCDYNVNNFRNTYDRNSPGEYQSDYINEELGESNVDDREDNIDVSIYRYKFTQNFMDELYKFSKIHQYDDRVSFKEAWEEWVEESEELIEGETLRLEDLGYEGDVLDKMFKSARYYFRKKSTTKIEPKERRKYIGVQKDLLDAMDTHIKTGINSDEYKPSDGFNHFCINNKDILKAEIERLLENKINSDDIMKKIKKTYKNRYFIKISK